MSLRRNDPQGIYDADEWRGHRKKKESRLVTTLAKRLVLLLLLEQRVVVDIEEDFSAHSVKRHQKNFCYMQEQSTLSVEGWMYAQSSQSFRSQGLMHAA
jgi:hypothetical protein